VLAYGSDQFESVGTLQPDVADDHVWRGMPKRRDRIVDGLDSHDLCSGEFQRCSKQIAGIGIVVNDEDIHILQCGKHFRLAINSIPLAAAQKLSAHLFEKDQFGPFLEDSRYVGEDLGLPVPD
jgi:hypothetical protein